MLYDKCIRALSGLYLYGRKNERLLRAETLKMIVAQFVSWIYRFIFRDIDVTYILWNKLVNQGDKDLL